MVAKSDTTIVGDNLLNAKSEGDYVIIFCCRVDVWGWTSSTVHTVAASVTSVLSPADALVTSQKVLCC